MHAPSRRFLSSSSLKVIYMLYINRCWNFKGAVCNEIFWHKLNLVKLAHLVSGFKFSSFFEYVFDMAKPFVSKSSAILTIYCEVSSYYKSLAKSKPFSKIILPGNQEACRIADALVRLNLRNIWVENLVGLHCLFNTYMCRMLLVAYIIPTCVGCCWLPI